MNSLGIRREPVKPPPSSIIAQPLPDSGRFRTEANRTPSSGYRPEVTDKPLPAQYYRTSQLIPGQPKVAAPGNKNDSFSRRQLAVPRHKRYQPIKKNPLYIGTTTPGVGQLRTTGDKQPHPALQRYASFHQSSFQAAAAVPIVHRRASSQDNEALLGTNELLMLDGGGDRDINMNELAQPSYQPGHFEKEAAAFEWWAEDTPTRPATPPPSQPTSSRRSRSVSAAVSSHNDRQASHPYSYSVVNTMQLPPTAAPQQRTSSGQRRSIDVYASPQVNRRQPPATSRHRLLEPVAGVTTTPSAATMTVHYGGHDTSQDVVAPVSKPRQRLATPVSIWKPTRAQREAERIAAGDGGGSGAALNGQFIAGSLSTHQQTGSSRPPIYHSRSSSHDSPLVDMFSYSSGNSGGGGNSYYQHHPTILEQTDSMLTSREDLVSLHHYETLPDSRLMEVGSAVETGQTWDRTKAIGGVGSRDGGGGCVDTAAAVESSLAAAADCERLQDKPPIFYSHQRSRRYSRDHVTDCVTDSDNAGRDLGLNADDVEGIYDIIRPLEGASSGDVIDSGGITFSASPQPPPPHQQQPPPMVTDTTPAVTDTPAHDTAPTAVAAITTTLTPGVNTAITSSSTDNTLAAVHSLHNHRSRSLADIHPAPPRQVSMLRVGGGGGGASVGIGEYSVKKVELRRRDSSPLLTASQTNEHVTLTAAKSAAANKRGRNMLRTSHSERNIPRLLTQQPQQYDNSDELTRHQLQQQQFGRSYSMRVGSATTALGTAAPPEASFTRRAPHTRSLSRIGSRLSIHNQQQLSLRNGGSSGDLYDIDNYNDLDTEPRDSDVDTDLGLLMRLEESHGSLSNADIFHLLQEALDCEPEVVFELAAYALQAAVGDYTQ